jgi:hypothetical protein
VKKGDRLFIDTNAIIEAHRVKCWKAITAFYKVETVEECQKECATGNQQRRKYILVDSTALGKTVQVHKVSEAMRRALIALDPAATVLDPGEFDLISCAVAQQDAWFICAPDKAAVASLFRLELLERVTALETIADHAGMHRLGFRGNFSSAWLQTLKVKLELDIL